MRKETKKRLLILADCLYNAIVEEDKEKMRGIINTINEVRNE